MTPFRARTKTRRRRLEAPLAIAATALLAMTLVLTSELRDLRGHYESFRETAHEGQESLRLELETERARAERELEAREQDIGHLESVRDKLAQEIATLREQIGRPPSPPPVRSLVNLPFAVLSPQTLRGPEDDLASLSLAERVLLILQVDNTEPFTSYRLKISDPGGKEIWKRNKLVLASRSSELTVVLPGDLFRPGRYVLALSGLRDGTITELPSYRLEIVAGP